VEKINRLTEAVEKLKAQGVKSQAIPFEQFVMNRQGLVTA
jgi:hypothetical protein